jgi:hypothetical protein
MKMKDRKLTLRWGHGALMHHDMPCDECDGTGMDEDDNCSTCSGEKTLRWGSFYEADDSHCDFCKRENVGIAAMYEGGHPDAEWVCLRCYLTHHFEQCQCTLWKKAEEAFGIKRGTCFSSSLPSDSMKPSRLAAMISGGPLRSSRLPRSRTVLFLSSIPGKRLFGMQRGVGRLLK